MRISDWSSDVCSSDLGDLKPGVVILAAEDRRKDDRAGPRPPLVVAADDLAAAVFIGDRELGDQAQLAEGADEFLVPILDALDIVHAVAEHHSKRVRARLQHLGDAGSVVEACLAIIWQEIVLAWVRERDCEYGEN